MTRIRTVLVACLLAGAVGLPAIVSAQGRPRPVVRIGQDYTLSAGQVVREVVVIGGTATIEGRVEGDVVVVLGHAQLASTASIDGDFVVVSGGADVSSGARVGGDLVIVGGGFDPPAGFVPGGEQVVIGSNAVGTGLHAIGPWITRGLFWGRPVVPELPWIWVLLAIFFLVYLTLNIVFNQPVRACADTLADKPLTTFLAGLLVLLLAGPVSLLLVVSVVGMVAVPFVYCAIFLAWIVGKVGVARWIGMSLVREESPDSKPQALRSFAIGFAVVTVAYMVPILGFVAWTIVGVLGLGAATLAFIAGYRREHPSQPLTPSIGPPAPSVGPSPASYDDGRTALPIAQEAGHTVDAPTAGPLVAPDLASFPRAAFMDRLGAFVLDAILVLITTRLLRGPGPFNDGGGFFLLLLAYHIGFWAWKGTTVGGIICQLRVVRVDGTRLRFVDALVRGLSSIFSFAVLGLGCLWILKDQERQSWHDKIAGMYVVKVPRNWPL